MPAASVADQVAVARHLTESGRLPAFYYGIAGPRCDAFVALRDAEFTTPEFDGPDLFYRLNDAGRAWLAGQES